MLIKAPTSEMAGESAPFVMAHISRLCCYGPRSQVCFNSMEKKHGGIYLCVFTYLFIYEKAIIHLSMGGLCLLLSAFAVPNLFLTLGTDLENSAALPKIIVGIAVP